MRLMTIGAVAAAALLTAAAAIAAPPAGRGKPSPTRPACTPKVTVILAGTVAANGAPTSVSVTVTGGNRFARAYRTNPPTQATVLLSPTTKVVRGGTAADPAALQPGDRVNVRAVVCKADLAGGVAPQLTAVRLVAKPSPAEADS